MGYSQVLGDLVVNENSFLKVFKNYLDFKIGFECEGTLAQIYKLNNELKVGVRYAYNYSIFSWNAFNSELGLDGSDRIFEYRSKPYDLWDYIRRIDLIYKRFIKTFAYVQAYLMENKTGVIVYNFPNRLRMACGVHIHFDYDILGLDIDEIIEAITSVVILTKKLVGDRSRYSSYGEINAYREQERTLEARGFESVLYQSPQWFYAFWYNLLYSLLYYYEKGKPVSLKNLPICFKKFRKWSQRNSVPFKIRRIARFEYSSTEWENEYYAIHKGTRFAIVRAKDVQNGFEIASRITGIDIESLKTTSDRVYLLKENNDFIGVIKFNRLTCRITGIWYNDLDWQDKKWMYLKLLAHREYLKLDNLNEEDDTAIVFPLNYIYKVQIPSISWEFFI